MHLVTKTNRHPTTTDNTDSASPAGSEVVRKSGHYLACRRLPCDGQHHTRGSVLLGVTSKYKFILPLMGTRLRDYHISLQPFRAFVMFSVSRNALTPMGLLLPYACQQRFVLFRPETISRLPRWPKRGSANRGRSPAVRTTSPATPQVFNGGGNLLILKIFT